MIVKCFKFDSYIITYLCSKFHLMNGCITNLEAGSFRQPTTMYVHPMSPSHFVWSLKLRLFNFYFKNLNLGFSSFWRKCKCWLDCALDHCTLSYFRQSLFKETAMAKVGAMEHYHTIGNNLANTWQILLTFTSTISKCRLSHSISVLSLHSLIYCRDTRSRCLSTSQ